MSPAGKRGRKPGIYDGEGIAFRHQTPGKAKYVRVVVEARKASRLDGSRNDGANAAHFAGGNGHTLARGAHQNAERARRSSHRIGDRTGEFGVVARGVRISAQIDSLVALDAQTLDQCLAQVVSCMVACGVNDHGVTISIPVSACRLLARTSIAFEAILALVAEKFVTDLGSRTSVGSCRLVAPAGA